MSDNQRIRKGCPELTTREGNPAFGFRQEYESIKAVPQSEPETLYTKVKAVIDKYEGHGISKKNAYRFRQSLEKERGDWTKIQFLVANFMLAADGLNVLKAS